jgi:hypothetical protein
MPGSDDWKDGSISRDEFKEYADYMAELAAAFMTALQARGFSREEALRMAIALVPGGFSKE